MVKSFYAPYFCPNCDQEKVLLVETSRHGPAPLEAPSAAVTSAIASMDFDDMQDSYFAFLSNPKKIVTDSRVDSVINEFTPTDGDRKIRCAHRRHQPGGSGTGSKSGGSGVHSSSLPSIPSLPSIRTTTGTGPGRARVEHLRHQRLWRQLGVSGVRSTAAALAELEARRAQTSPQLKAPDKSSGLWAAVSLIIVAVALLGYVMFGKH